jgi:catechol 2,3-dioxygenase-like lactoylglutathione lyase family enzyme
MERFGDQSQAQRFRRRSGHSRAVDRRREAWPITESTLEIYHAARDREMFDHLGIVVKDLKRSASLYAHMLAPLGLKIVEKHRTGPGEGWVVIGCGQPSSPFLVIGAGKPGFWPAEAIAGASPVHLCFKAPSQDAVDRFYRAGLAHGAKDNGAPGIRRPPFYCAFLIDLDGNNVEAGSYLASVAAPLPKNSN